MASLPPASIARANIKSVVNFVLLSSGLIGLGGISIVDDLQAHVVGVLSAMVIVLVVQFISRKQLVTASVLLAALFWISITLLTYLSGGYDSPFLIVFLAFVMVANIFLGSVGGIVSVFITLGTMAGVYWMGANGLIPDAVIIYDLPDQTVVAAMSVIIMFGSSLLLGNTIELTAQLNEAHDQTMMGFVRSLGLRDEDTLSHSDRVVGFTMKLAKAFEFGHEQLENIRRGAILHDIGKIGISDTILLKPGPLDDEERKKMEQHPLIANEMLAGVEYLKDSMAIPLYHHERWDGSGYPQGLKGEEIPIEARIFAVADVWDALTSDRPYRKKWTRAKTKAYIVENAGVLFDQKIVEKFVVLEPEFE